MNLSPIANDSSADDGQISPPVRSSQTYTTQFKRVLVIANPASGQDKPILGTLNHAFSAAEIDWDLRLTKKAGDAYRLAQEAAADGWDCVAVYGGDGTVMEAGNGLVNSRVPMAILPGGTANVMSMELGIPSDLARALALVCAPEAAVRRVDVGRARGHYFLLRLGIGWEAESMNKADVSIKERVGRFAYVISGLQALVEMQVAHYRITVDGETYERDGYTCAVANSGNLGFPGLKMNQKIEVDDGLLDVIVASNLELAKLFANPDAARLDEVLLPHWQGRHIRIETDPPQPIICDGEPLEAGAIDVEVVPSALGIVVP